MTITLTPEQRDLARHALGLPHHSRTSWRNHYVTGAGGADHEAWSIMVGMGAARRWPGSPLTGGDDLFRLTRAGAEAALESGETLDMGGFPT